MGPADWANVILNGAQLAFQIAQGVVTWIMMEKMLNGEWLYKQARKICIRFDTILINFADSVYNIFCEVVNGTLLTPEIIDGLMGRMYLLIGILIFFKIAITMIRYIVAPETFLDDKVGAGSLVKRVIIGCILIIAVPLIFGTANKLQSAIIKDRVIERIILPDYAFKELTETNNVGKRIAIITFQGFFGWNQSVSKDMYPAIYSSYSKAIVYENMDLFNKSYISEESSSGDYVIYYIPLLSTLAVGYVLYSLIKYTLEIAFRSFKLSFLQIISPFVIVNYMLNPGHDESMKKWTMSTVSTYILMFIRVITLWFMALMAYYLMHGIPADEGGATSLINSTDPIVRTFIVLALFVFLKDLPKLLSEMLGIDLQENETVNGLMQQGVNAVKGYAMGRVGMQFARAQMMANTAGAALGGAAGTAGAYAKLKKENPGMKKGQGLALAGTSSYANISAPWVGNVGGTLSTPLGSTTHAPIARSASLGSQHYIGNPTFVGKEDEKDKKEPENKTDEPKTNKPKTQNQIEEIMASEEDARYSSAPKTSTPVEHSSSPTINVGAEVSENIFNNNDNHSYISSDGKIDLSGTSNPIVQQIRTEVNNQLSTSGSSNINVTNDTVNQVIKEVASDPSQVSRREVEVITQKVYEQAYVTATETPSITPSVDVVPQATYTPVELSNNGSLRQSDLPPLTPRTIDPNANPYQGDKKNMVDEQ